jgi:hypothetical protein
MYRSPHLSLAKFYWKNFLEPGDIAIDATCGNGHDTLYLATLPLSSLFALDIQEDAIKNARALLKTHLMREAIDKVLFFRVSHRNFEILPLPAPPRLIVYNLGYLPGGDKTITTETGSTLESVSSALSILAKNGAISITCYPGHNEGKKEEEALLTFAQSLPASQWDICYHRWVNRFRSPSVLWISRILRSSKSAKQSVERFFIDP